jgi:hypothetical protein
MGGKGNEGGQSFARFSNRARLTGSPKGWNRRFSITQLRIRNGSSCPNAVVRSLKPCPIVTAEALSEGTRHASLPVSALMFLLREPAAEIWETKAAASARRRASCP